MSEAGVTTGVTTGVRESTGPAPGTETYGTIVIVDDDSLLSQTLAMNLEDAGFSSSAFHEGRAAVQYLANGGLATAVVLDWQMPGMDGEHVLQALRALACAIPVIVISGDARFKGPALAGGAADFIEKSKSFEILLAHLKVALGRVGRTQRDHHRWIPMESSPDRASVRPSTNLSEKPQPTGAADALDTSCLVARYRQDATRLVGLAATSPFSETKDQFLQLAQHYAALAAHLASRATSRRDR